MEKVVLADRQDVRAAIVLPAEPDAQEREAARELQWHIERIVGVSLPVLGPQEALEGRLPIRLGAVAGAALQERILAESEDVSAFVLQVAADGVGIVGRTSLGTRYGAYELLEQLGVRWFMPGELGLVLPETDSLQVATQQRVQAPSFRERYYQNMRPELVWGQRMRLGGTGQRPGAHGIPPFQGRGPIDRYFAAHPEYFALVKGQRQRSQLCLSHPEVMTLAVQAARDFFAANPEETMLSLGPDDAYGYCECDGCKALDGGVWDPMAGHVSMTDRYVWFFNRLLEAITPEYPDKQLAFYAYQHHQMPPVAYRPDPRIIPVFAPISLDRIHGMSNPLSPDRSFYRKLMEAWREQVPVMYERGYDFNLACPGFPFSMVHRMRDETPILRDLGIVGRRVETMPSWASHSPSLYIGAKLMWDADADVDALLADFYEKFFGPAAEPMGAYVARLDAAYRDTPCASGGSHCLPHIFDAAWLAAARQLFREAVARVAPDSIYARRVEAFAGSLDYLDAFLTMLDHRNAFRFAEAHQAMGQVYALQERMVGYVLENPPELRERYHARLLYPREQGDRSYFNRFWSPTIKSAYERTVERGQLVAALPDTWDFLIDHSGVGELVGYHRAGAIGGNWQPLRTTSATWGDQGLYYYYGDAWYRTAIALPADAAGRPLYLWFGGVDERATVWLNGQLLGTSEHPGDGLPGVRGTFRPFDMHATAAARPGEINHVAVKITRGTLNELGTGGIVAPVMFWSPKE